jgi:hypothetical protein
MQNAVIEGARVPVVADKAGMKKEVIGLVKSTETESDCRNRQLEDG